MKKLFTVLLVVAAACFQLTAQDADFRDIHKRGNLDNALHAMSVRKEACVAFLGGSITEMKGWRDMVKEELRQRFPDTEFRFIDAGISSLGSTPHAFRFEHDVLSNGTPDLLFLEAAVNDDTNGFSPQAQVRAMEGIVRHALKANPMMDIVILDFIYDDFLPMMDSGEMPDVFYNHERVANHYHINSINFITEVHSRMRSGQFDWKKFGGTHPAEFGHRIYTATIADMLDSFIRPAGEYSPCPHPLPSPLDEACYEAGGFVDIGEAYALRGFRLDEDWKPESDSLGTRPGFVDVPMLVASDGGSLKLDFEGNAVGIFCVAGFDAGVLEYRIDKGPWHMLDTYTKWSRRLYLPWTYMLADGLENTRHTLVLKVKKGGKGGCIIRNFVVNRAGVYPDTAGYDN